ncbi:MAG: S-layer protein domain-containing protein [Methanosarcina sp.]
MKPNIQRTLFSLFVSFIACLLLAPSGLAAPSPAISGIPFDTNETLSDGFHWNATTFGGFVYPVNKHKDFVASENWWGERLEYIEKDGKNELGKANPGNNSIGEDELVYSTRSFSNKYELASDLELNAKTTPEKLGGMFYYKLAWFGKPYVAVGNDSTRLANLVLDQGSDKKQLKAGDSWDLGKNYSLVVNQIDVKGYKVWFSLYKNGEELESGIVNTDGTVADKTFTATADFGDKNDQLYFVTYVDSVFTSASESFAVFKYTWLIDKDNMMIIKNGDEYQGFEVKEASESGIILENSKLITLNLDKDEKTYFTDLWYFQTSDKGKGSTSAEGYIIYPAKDLNVSGNYTLRGVPCDTNETQADGFNWNATTFGGFNYPVNKHKDFVASENWWGERLEYIETDGQNELGKVNPGNNVIGEGELVYSTRPFSNKYELVSDLELNAKTTPVKLGGMLYYKLAWFGKPYVAVGNDCTQLANLVISQTSGEKKDLKIGGSWDLGKNYSLVVNQIDVEGNKVWFSLYKNGEELESGIVNTDGTVENQTFTATADFGDKNDQLYFVTYVDSVFMSGSESFAVFKYTWLVDKDNMMLIKNGDEYQGFEVKEALESGIVLKNSKSITLNLDKDEKTYFTDLWYFQTSDKGKGSTSAEGYVIYPATDVIIEDKAVSGPKDNATSGKEANITEKANGTEEKENVTETVLNTTSEATSNESSSSIPLIQSKATDSKGSNSFPEKEAGEEPFSKAPGFEVLPWIFGISICQAFLKRRD